MALADNLLASIQATFAEVWEIRNGRVVPDADSLTLGNKGVRLDATVLYADLRDSTPLVDQHTPEQSGEVYKAFLWCCAQVIRQENGTITAYDGDRIMALFIGDAKNTSAARAALKINWAVGRVLNPALQAAYGIFGPYAVSHTVGVDTSPLLAAKTGVRNANDIVWIGRAANYAAKLCTLEKSHQSFITAEVFDSMNDAAKFAARDGSPMWEARTWPVMGNRLVYRSGWAWCP